MFSMVGFVFFNLFGSLYVKYVENSSPLAASIQINKTVGDPNPLTGETFIYTLQYRCASLTDDCLGTVITDPLPPEVEYVGLAGSAHTTSETYNPATHTVTFNFVDPLISGSSGQVQVQVRFPNGYTPDGTIASNTATISASNAPSDNSTVDATASASPKPVLEKQFVNGGSVNGNTTYQLKFCNTEGITNLNGTPTLYNIEVRDTLPAGSVYVQHNTNWRVTTTYDPVDHVIIFTRDSLAPGECMWPKVTIQYPDPPFSIGTTVTNKAYYTYTPAGGPTVTDESEVSYILTAPNYYAATYKTNSHGSNFKGSSGTYYIYSGVEGTEDMNDFCVNDTFPDGIEVTGFDAGGWYYGGITGAEDIIDIYYTTNLNGPTLVPGSPFSIWNPDSFIMLSDLGLTAGGAEYITSINWCFGDAPAGFATYEEIEIFYNIKPDAPTGIATNCAEISTSSTGFTLEEDCNDLDILANNPGVNLNPIKGTAYSGPFDKGDIIDFQLVTRNELGSADSIENPIVYDLLPEGLSYVPGSWYLPAWGNLAGYPDPVFTHIADYKGTGRDFLRWEWSGVNSIEIPGGERVAIQFKAEITDEALGGFPAFYNYFYVETSTPIVNCWGNGARIDSFDFDNDSDYLEELCGGRHAVNINEIVILESEKLVKGQLDTAWTKYPETGYTVPGGLADYQLIVRNKGNIQLDSVIVIDILPFVGDEGVINLDPRDSRWRPNLVGQVMAPPGVTVYYSTEGNPCRSAEGILPSGPPSCSVANWSITPPVDITTVQSLKFDFGSIILNPNDSLVLEWPMRAPVNALTTIGAQPDSTAWNSFGYIGQRVDNGAYSLPSEPVKVGISMNTSVPAVIGDYVWMDNNQNGIQNSGEPGYNGMRVELFRDNGDGIADPNVDTYVNFTVTANGGFYLFPYLPSGDYFLVFYKPAPYGVTTVDVGGNDAVDSDGILSNYNGFTVAITPVTNLSGTEYDLDWDLGVYPNGLAAIGNYVWADTNSDGVQNEPASNGLNGVTVNLYDNSNPGTIFATTVTSNDMNGVSGYYLFDQLNPGNYFVEFVLPTSTTFATLGSSGSSDPLDSDANTTTGRTEVFALATNIFDDTWDAGLNVSGTEICGNGIDDDLDGEIDEDCVEICGDGIDNDGDGFIDEDCEICDDGIDNDGDGLIDCEDPDCTPNLLTNGGFEDTGSIAFSTTFEGSPAALLPKSSTAIPGWTMDYSCPSPPAPCPDSYLIDDTADNVNNPEGDYFLWLAQGGYCGRQSFSVDLDVCYQITMDVAAWSSPGPQDSTTFAVEALGGGINNGPGIPLVLFQATIPASTSWSNLNWQSLSFNWTGPANTSTNLFFSQISTGVVPRGLAIDNIQVREICCIDEICNDNIDNDGDGDIDEECFKINGTVFEDINFGGGDGRNYSTADASAQASGWTADEIGVENTIVELYDITGAFIASTTTDINGDYSFDAPINGTYAIRVVNNSVNSNRSSNATGQTIIPVQTFRTDGTTEFKNEVGGSSPALVDANQNTTSANLSTFSTATTDAQSVTMVVVNNATIDDVDFGYNFDVVVNTNDTGQGSLRQFILNSNELDNTNLDQEDNPTNGVSFPKDPEWETSIFMIPGAGVHTIQPITALNSITDPKTHVSAYTQAGSSQGPIASRTLNVELDGNNNLFDGLTIYASDVQVSGLSINSFRKGVYSNLNGAVNSFVWGNYIGTKVDGTTTGTNSSSGVNYYNIEDSFIGTNGDNNNDANEGNLIADSYYGAEIRATENVLVAGNYIGTDKTGMLDLGNRYIGVHIRDASGTNYIGFNDAATNNTSAELRNVIAGNGTDGVRISNGDDQIIAGNYIGTNALGTGALSNGGYGIQFTGTTNNTIIGTNSNGDDDVKERNIISGNGGGIRLASSGSGSDNIIAGNFIGTDYTGNVALGNLNNGLEINDSFINTIVGTNGDNVRDVIERNVISGNAEDGIRLDGTTGNTISGNYIGVGADGNTALGNGKRGIFIVGAASNNVIGYDPSMANSNELVVGNQIKNNNDAGIGLSGTGTQNRISRNQLENNSGLGIDLEYDLVTPNDNGDGDTGPNNVLNFPVFESAEVVGTNLVISGYAPAGAEIEFFIADGGPNPNPLPSGYTASFGEGAVYLFTLLEGSGADGDATTGTYTDDGTGTLTPKTQNRFLVTIDTTGFNLTNGINITSTATDAADNTSEFSGWTKVCITRPTINLSQNTACINETISVSSSDIGDPTTYNWNFGIDASPSTATGIGPHNISFTSCGNKAVSLTVEKDGCSITVDSIIQIIDNTDPVWDTSPQDLILECNSSKNLNDSISLWLVNHGYGVASDNCSSFRITNNYTGLTADCGSTASTTVDFTAIDSCGNSAIGTANIQILDTQAPEISEVNDVTVDCDDIPAPPSPTVLDSCDLSPSMTYQEVTIQHPNSDWKSIGSCSLLYTVTSGVYDNKGTPSTADDEMSFVLTIIGQNTGPAWSANVNGTAVSGSYYESYPIGPVLSNGTTLNFTVVDDNDASCTILVEIDAINF